MRFKEVLSSFKELDSRRAEYTVTARRDSVDGVISFKSLEELKKRLEDYSEHTLNLDLFDPSLNVSLYLDGEGLSSKFDSISVKYERRSHVIKNLAARRIEVVGADVLIDKVSCSHLVVNIRSGIVKVHNCRIGQLSLIQPENQVDTEVRVVDSQVACLWCSGAPKVRTIDFSGTNFSRFSPARLKVLNEFFRGERLRESRSSFSLVRIWAENNGDSKLANVSRAEELAHDRLESRGFEWLVLTFWLFFSDFGLSPIRPLLLILLSSVVLFAALYCYGTTVSEANLIGWRADLMEAEGLRDDILRAIIGAVEGVVSPLSVFSTRQLIIPSNFSLAIAKIAHGYFSISMLLLSGFGLRRRFRQFG